VVFRRWVVLTARTADCARFRRRRCFIGKVLPPNLDFKKVAAMMSFYYYCNLEITPHNF
jgi:hypothetical protein